MKSIFRYLTAIIFTTFALACFAARPAMVASEVNSLAPMLKNVMPTIVNISVRGQLPMMNIPIMDKQKRKHDVNISPRFEDLGSGVIVNAEQGYILTNSHVVKDADSITVTLKDGRKMPAKIIGSDAPSDIAVIQVKAKRLDQVSFGDSDKLNVGDFVCAIGSPFGLEQTVTSGVISGLERSNLGIEGYENFIQTDAPINPGNSGGALVNMKGELIGINTAIISPAPGSAGIGLAIPSNMAKSVMIQLIKYGKVKRGIVGVMVQDLTPALAEAFHTPSAGGALVSQALEGSPAAAAGLKSKDIIVKIMDKPVHSATQISNTISLMEIGSTVDLGILRDGKPMTLKAKIADPDALKKVQQDAPKSLLTGLMLDNFNKLLDNQQIIGVSVLYVDDSSIAYSCGLRAGDVILSAANKPVKSIDELQEIAANNSKQLLLEVKRGMSGNIFLVLEE